MSKNIFSHKDLMTQLSDQIKIEHHKITGQFCYGDLPVIEKEDCFYFRSTERNNHVTVNNPVTGFCGEMSSDDADFIASMLAIIGVGWEYDNATLLACHSTMLKECRNSRPGIIEFIG